MAEGYEAPIFPGLWRRLCTYNMPHLCFQLWLGLGVLQIVAGFSLGGGAGVVVALLAVVVEFFAMQWLTQRDIQWDQRMQAAPKYRRFYGAG